MKKKVQKLTQILENLENFLCQQLEVTLPSFKVSD